jgi:hypothetical protein
MNECNCVNAVCMSKYLYLIYLKSSIKSLKRERVSPLMVLKFIFCVIIEMTDF